MRLSIATCMSNYWSCQEEHLANIVSVLRKMSDFMHGPIRALEVGSVTLVRIRNLVYCVYTVTASHYGLSAVH